MKCSLLLKQHGQKPSDHEELQHGERSGVTGKSAAIANSAPQTCDQEGSADFQQPETVVLARHRSDRRHSMQRFSHTGTGTAEAAGVNAPGQQLVGGW
jgi:hypothetical protein